MRTKTDLIPEWSKWTGTPESETRHFVRVCSDEGILPFRLEPLTVTHKAMFLLAALSPTHKEAAGFARQAGALRCVTARPSLDIYGCDLLTVIERALRGEFTIVELQASIPSGPVKPLPGELRRENVAHHRLRHVERIQLGTSYPDVIDRVAEVMARVPAMPRPPVLTVDATGCGRPVMDLMRKNGLEPLGVTITAGSGETVEQLDARVAKKVLASTVAVALDTARLQVVATGPDVETLKRELRNFRVKVTAGQNESFESWREADHDDLVLAAALAIWTGERLRTRFVVNPRWRLLGRS